MDNFRRYDPEKDKEAVHQIWKEIGWISEGDEEKMDTFTRLWMGVGTPTSSSVTDDLYAPNHLLKQLDEILRLPKPHPDWDF